MTAAGSAPQIVCHDGSASYAEAIRRALPRATTITAGFPYEARCLGVRHAPFGEESLLTGKGGPP